jgi:hypothetical protein
VSNGDRVAVSPDTARGVNAAFVVAHIARRQLQRPAVLDRGVDQLVVEERGNIGAKLRVPLRASSARIGVTLRSARGLQRKQASGLRAATPFAMGLQPRQ